MSEGTRPTDTPTDRVDDLARGELDGTDQEVTTPVGTEPADHDGVLEMLDVHDERVNDVMYEQSYSPPERQGSQNHYGLTPDEESSTVPLDVRLAQEEPDVTAGAAGALGAGSPDLPADADVDGELLDDQVGTVRAGRLVEPDMGGGPDTEPSAVATDAGFAGGAYGAEEAAVHVVPDEGDDDFPDPMPQAQRPMP